MKKSLPIARFLFAVLGLLPVMSQATVLVVNDTCGSSLTGTITGTGTLTVGQLGNLVVTGFGASYSAGVGDCEVVPPWATPKCVLTASQTAIEPGAAVTLHARCRTAPDRPISAYTWSGPAGTPALPGDAASLSSFSVTFPAAGAFSYSVGATNGNGAGASSPQVTVLVGPQSSATSGPACTLTLSPNSVMQNTSANMKVVCQPEASSYVWDAAETNAPAASGGSGSLLFQAPGAFTYKVRGANSSGVAGPKASATVTVISDGSCVPGPVQYDQALPTAGMLSDDVVTYNGWVAAFSFSATVGHNPYFYLNQHTAYTTYPLPNTSDWTISRCKGDFNVTGGCNQPGNGTYGTMTAYTSTAPYYACSIQPGVTYYLNVKQTSCIYGSGGYCGFRIYRMN
jgi:hypothetical protein